MARETGRAFDAENGAVHVTVEDELGRRHVHTIYLERRDLCGACGQPVVTETGVDVEATIGQHLADADRHAGNLKRAMKAAGWQG